MSMKTPTFIAITTSVLLASTPAFTDEYMRDDDQKAAKPGMEKHTTMDQREMAEERDELKEMLNQATKTIKEMRADPELAKAMSEAKGLFIAPDFARGALVAGGRSGQGVLITQNDNRWEGPAFYNYGAISLGVQAGGSVGEMAMLLMSDQAVESFTQDNNFSLNADAGLTIINWSENTQATVGNGDVIVWTDTEGAFAGGAISVSNIASDDEANQAYYGQKVTPSAIVKGNVTSKKANPLASSMKKDGKKDKAMKDEKAEGEMSNPDTELAE